jgi:hypothetical protein
LKQGGALLSLISNFVVGYTISKVQENQEGLKFNGTHQFLVVAHDVNFVGGNVNGVSTGSVLETISKGVWPGINGEGTKYSGYQDA